MKTAATGDEDAVQKRIAAASEKLDNDDAEGARADIKAVIDKYGTIYSWPSY